MVFKASESPKNRLFFLKFTFDETKNEILYFIIRTFNNPTVDIPIDVDDSL